MPLHLIREDITRMAVDAIVAAGNARPGTPAPTGGVNGSIHKRAGEKLLDALRRLGGIRTGGATLTEAYDLPCRYVIHTAGPVWRGGRYGEEQLLRACYREALLLAEKQGFESLAFPLISAGTYGYPKAEALQAAASEIRAFLKDHDMMVYLVVYDQEAFRVSSELFADVEQFIDQHYVDVHYVARNRREEDWGWSMPRSTPSGGFEEAGALQGFDDDWGAPAATAEEESAPPVMGEDEWADMLFSTASSGCDEQASSGSSFGEDWSGGLTETEAERPPLLAPREELPPPRSRLQIDRAWGSRECEPIELAQAPGPLAAVPSGLEQRLHQLDEGFPEMLLRLIDERGMKDSACYRKANVDRKLFSKIKNIPNYTPKKSTVMAFCVALELEMPACRELLSRAGYAMSRSNMFDVIVEYFILKGKYDVDLINQALFQYDQPLLGSNVGM